MRPPQLKSHCPVGAPAPPAQPGAQKVLRDYALSARGDKNPMPFDPLLLFTVGSFVSSGWTVTGRGWSAVCWPFLLLGTAGVEAARAAY